MYHKLKIEKCSSMHLTVLLSHKLLLSYFGNMLLRISLLSHKNLLLRYIQYSNAHKPGAYTIKCVGFHGMSIIPVGLVIAALIVLPYTCGITMEVFFLSRFHQTLPVNNFEKMDVDAQPNIVQSAYSCRASSNLVLNHP